MKDSTISIIAILIVNIFLVIPFTAYISMSAWNEVLVPLTFIKPITIWQAGQLSVALGLNSILFTQKTNS